RRGALQRRPGRVPRRGRGGRRPRPHRREPGYQPLPRRVLGGGRAGAVSRRTGGGHRRPAPYPKNFSSTTAGPAHGPTPIAGPAKIGRASCRERVKLSVYHVSLKKKARVMKIISVCLNSEYA